MTDDFKAQVRNLAWLGENLYRVGTPSIGETFGRRWNAGRDSGGLGTGVYAFTTRSAAERNIDRSSPDRDLFVLEDALSNPIRPADFQTTVSLNDASTEAARLINRVRDGETTYSDARTDPPRRLKRKAREVLYDTPELRDRYGYDSDEFTRDWIDAAKTADMVQDGIDSRTAVQPINLLLYPGFDGVYPRGEAGRSGTYGAVIFKEKVDDCVGRETTEGETVEASVLNDCFSR